MAKNNTKGVLAEKDAAAAQKAFAACEPEFLDPKKPRANVVGLGVGMKWKNGEPTGAPALVALVNQKLEPAQVGRADMVPAKLQDMQTDVLAVGELFAGGGAPAAGAQTLAKRIRPAERRLQRRPSRSPAGTIGTCVYDMLPEGGTTPPRHGSASRAPLAFSNNRSGQQQRRQSRRSRTAAGARRRHRPGRSHREPQSLLFPSPSIRRCPGPSTTISWMRRSPRASSTTWTARSTGWAMCGAGGKRRRCAWGTSCRRPAVRPTTPSAGSRRSTRPSTSATVAVGPPGSATRSSLPTCRRAATPARS